MAKTNGLGWTTASIDDASGTPRAIKNDFTEIDLATPRAAQDMTGIDKFAIERQVLIADASVNCKGVCNFAANSSHDVFKTTSSASVVRTVTLTVAGATLAMEMLPTDYQIARGNDGALTFTVPMVLADGAVPTWA